MTVQDASRQQLDPAGTLGSYIPSIVLGGAGFAWSVVAILVNLPNADVPALLGVALLLLAAAYALVILAVHPYRAPLPALAHLGVHTLVLLAFAASTLATWESGDASRSGWVPLTLGLIIAALAPYRPAWEIVAAGTVSAVVIGLVTYSRARSAATDQFAIAIAIGAVVVVLALCVGSAVYSRSILDVLTRWQRRDELASEALAGELREDIARSVQRDRVTILNRDIVPFFTDLLARGQITDADRRRASEIAADIRGVMVADADRSWLEAVLLFGGHVGPGVVDDPDNLAASLDTAQRTALRALIVALAGDPRVKQAVSVMLADDGKRCSGTLTAGIDAPEHSMRTVLGSCFAVLRSAFPSFTVDFHQPKLIVRFSYER